MRVTIAIHPMLTVISGVIPSGVVPGSAFRCNFRDNLFIAQCSVQEPGER